jgi:hypothetical protein
VKINGKISSLRNFLKEKSDELSKVILMIVREGAIEHPIHKVIIREYQKVLSLPLNICIRLVIAIRKIKKLQ